MSVYTGIQYKVAYARDCMYPYPQYMYTLRVLLGCSGRGLVLIRVTSTIPGNTLRVVTEYKPAEESSAGLYSVTMLL